MSNFNCFSVEKENRVVDLFVFCGEEANSKIDALLEGFEYEWVKSNGFLNSANGAALIPSSSGALSKVIVKSSPHEYPKEVAKLVGKLPNDVVYQIKNLTEVDIHQIALYWGMEAYQFTRYKAADREPARLLFELTDKLQAVLNGIYLVRDLINTPTEDLNTHDFAEIIKSTVKPFGAKFTEVVGKKLLKENYPLVYTVGRASFAEPRMVHFSWGNPSHRKLSLVGKGVCYDTGGLSIKPTNFMLLMKKDMGGAAHALGLAVMIMQLNLPICLNVFLPLVDNAISSNAVRPGDVVKSRKGLTVEISNTDAEGRLILADALARACEDEPELIIDMSTLTGAARVAVGIEVAAMFARNDRTAQKLVDIGKAIDDWVWPLPLYKPYKEMIKSDIANINNATATPYAGAITAALFLDAFVDETIEWLHFDFMAWNESYRPGHPKGAEAHGLRTLFDYIQERFN